MRINGEWYFCDGGIVRPVIRGEIRSASGFWEPTVFLVDTGADRTVLSAATLDVLGLEHSPIQDKLGGVGGLVRPVGISTEIRLSVEEGAKALFLGSYAAFTELEMLDVSILGRDIMDMFAVIVDWPGKVVALISQRHSYHIETSRG